MIIRKAEYIASAVNPAQYPAGDAVEIALAGRSNVGKSSLINRFLGRRNLARTGNTPGKTQTLNFYLINDSWYFVDLPGYGYAKVAKEVKQTWGPMMESYLGQREKLVAVIQIVDIRHEPSREDREMHAWLRQKGLPTLVVATKADKIARGKRPQYLSLIAKAFELPDWHLIIPFSAETGDGLEEVHEAIEEILTFQVTKDKGVLDEDAEGTHED